MDTLKDISRYMGEVLGQVPEFRTLEHSLIARLPIFLNAAYDMVGTELFGTSFVIAFAKGTHLNTTPAQYQSHIRMIEQILGMNVALGLPVVPTYVRNRLVQKRLSFLVAGRQIFLPFLAVDLKERQPTLPKPARDTLSPPAQAVIISHLLGIKVQGLPLGDIAGQLGYSAMTLSKVAAELQAQNLAAAHKNGKTRLLEFPLSCRQLWENALPLMASPVRNKMFVKGRMTSVALAPVAGLSALSHFTAITDNPLPVYAMWHNRLRDALIQKTIVQCEVPEEADALIESWAYNPTTLAEMKTVDRLSLYLSLRDSEDERIQKELAILLGGMKW